jgi:predicted nucleotidyltransferase
MFVFQSPPEVDSSPTRQVVRSRGVGLFDRPPVYDDAMSEDLADMRPAPSLLLLRAHRDEILRVATNRGVSNIRIFGSVVRGDATPSSDIDLLVDFERGHRGLDLFAFAREVEELLGYPVEIGTGLDEVVRSRIESQLVQL